MSASTEALLARINELEIEVKMLEGSQNLVAAHQRLDELKQLRIRLAISSQALNEGKGLLKS